MRAILAIEKDIRGKRIPFAAQLHRLKNGDEKIKLFQKEITNLSQK